jgi:hypothetical protein
VKVYRDRPEVGQIVKDSPRSMHSRAERLTPSRAVPEPRLYSHCPSQLPSVRPGAMLDQQGTSLAAVIAFSAARAGQPSAPTLYRLGTWLGQDRRVDAGLARRAAFERALTLQPTWPKPTSDLGALARVKGDISRLRSVNSVGARLDPRLYRRR